jgi:hypothetical protein
MKKKALIVGCAILGMLMNTAAMADPWKDESGKGGKHRGYYGGDAKEEYWDGNCKVERKWKGNGDYKEERKCKAPRYVEPVLVPAYPVYPAQPGIVIQGTAVIK